MKQTLLRLFTWWSGATYTTRFWVWKVGKEIGTDEYGNTYYEGGLDSEGRHRRWVIYANDVTEATLIPPGWFGWMHHTTDVPPTKDDYVAKDWQSGWRPNLTGTSMAYQPKGSITGAAERPRVSGDYDAWSPGD